MCHARFVKHRAQAQALVEGGHVRVNKMRVTKCSTVLKAADVLTLAVHGRVRVVRVLDEAEKRGPASLARQLYEELLLPEKQDADHGVVC